MIVPLYDELFPSYPKSKQSDIDAIMRAYFMQTFQDLCIFFPPEEFDDLTKCKYDMKMINKQMPKADKEKLDKQFGVICIYKNLLINYIFLITLVLNFEGLHFKPSKF